MATRKRKAVVTEETETVTVSRRRRQAVIEDTVTDEHPVLVFAPGWHMPPLTGAAYRRHREQQVRRCLEFLVIRAADPNERETVQCATNVLRAGPGASLGESIHGRYA
jgi:hypothetical protein